MMNRRRWAVLISGRGSNLAALLDLRDEIDIRIVMSSEPKAYGLLRARRAGVPTALTPMVEVATKSGQKKLRIDWPQLEAELHRAGVTHIFLAGFMRIVPADFISRWQGRILNLHPSLLPQYPGLDSIARAFNERASIGVTVHEVNEEVDAGEIICQRHSLNAEELKNYSLASAEFLVHVDEQRVVKEAIRRWTN